MEIGDFAEHMFVRNTTNRLISLNLEGIENNKDLFLCFVDLFCKGLIACYGEGQSSVDFDSITLERFQHLQKKMRNAGIIANLDIIDNPVEIPTSINSHEIEMSPDDQPLESYYFRIFNREKTYQIHFTLEHRV